MLIGIAALIGMLAHVSMLFGVAALTGWVAIEQGRRTRPRAAALATLRLMGRAVAAVIAVLLVVAAGAVASPDGFRMGSIAPFSWPAFVDALDHMVGWTIGWPPLLIGPWLLLFLFLTFLLRRALSSAIDTPETINGADLAADRAGLLLRMGESTAARWIVQSVDYDRASPRMLQVAQQTFLANADPAGLCPYVPAGLAHGEEQSWRLASAICSGLSGDAGPAGWAIGRVRSSGRIDNFDILLTERVLGATGAGRRSTTIEWDKVDTLTSWRFGMATATAIAIPAELRSTEPAYMRGWTVLAPMTEMADRVAAAPDAAARGVLSSEAYVSLLSAASGEEEPPEALAAQIDELRNAFGAASGADRYTAMQALWGAGDNPVQSYAALVATARAAAGLPTSTKVGDDPWQLLGSMFAGGYDRNAMDWASQLNSGSRAWGVMAVGSPRPLAGVSAGSVGSFAGNDDSTGYLRSKFLVAGLAGLGRLSSEQAASAAGDLDLDLGKQTRWSRAIMAAAERREPGMVALIAAAGMQGEWSKIPPYHLYYIVRALREVGLDAEARMIAAEALVRV